MSEYRKESRGGGDYDDERGGRGGGGGFRRRRTSIFYTDLGGEIDYRDANQVRNFITERGKIVPRRISKLSSKHQRQISKAVKRARALGLIPFVSNT